MFRWTSRSLCRIIKMLSGEEDTSGGVKQRMRQGRFFEHHPGLTSKASSPHKPSLSSIYTFVLFDFYGISLQNKQQWLGTTPATRPVTKLALLWLGRVTTLGAMTFLLISTGGSAFAKDTSAEVIANHTQTPIPALSSLNLKFYYRLSFHLKSYFCIVSYLYVLIRVKEIRQVTIDIMVRLTSEADIRRVSQARRLLFAVWLLNVIANAAFFVWNAIDVELYDTLTAIRQSQNSQRRALNLKVATVLMNEILWAIYGFGWLIHGVLFMIWICFANYLVEKNIFSRQHLVSVKSLLASSNRGEPKPAWFHAKAAADLHLQYGSTVTVLPRRSLLQLYTALQTLTCLQEQVNEHLGLLPFFWLCELFLSTCLRITQVALLAGMRPSGNTMARLDKSIRSQIEYHLEYFVEYLTLTAFYLSFIAIVEYFASQRVTMFQLESSLVDAVESESKQAPGTHLNTGQVFYHQYHLQAGGSNGGMLCTRQSLTSHTLVLLTVAVMRKYISSRYMAWCKFNLNYRLVFAFINAAAPFSVMILSLHG